MVTHAQTGLTVAFIGTFIAILTLVTQYKDAKELLSKVDYKTLLFFIGLFVVVGGLEQTGVLEEIAGLISKLSGSNGMLMCAIILWISAIASAFVDNIPFAATMIPEYCCRTKADQTFLPESPQSHDRRFQIPVLQK